MGTNLIEHTGRSSDSLTSIRKSPARRNGVSAERGSLRSDENLFPMPNAYKSRAISEESWRSPTLVSSFPVTQQEKLSYSYASDDTSSASSFIPKSMFDAYNPPLSYEEQLLPHNQFMKMHMGVGNR